MPQILLLTRERLTGTAASISHCLASLAVSQSGTHFQEYTGELQYGQQELSSVFTYQALFCAANHVPGTTQGSQQQQQAA